MTITNLGNYVLVEYVVPHMIQQNFKNNVKKVICGMQSSSCQQQQQQYNNFFKWVLAVSLDTCT